MINKIIEIIINNKPVPYNSFEIKYFPKLKEFNKSNLPKN